MYQIAICDDEKSTCAILEEMILRYAGTKGMQFETSVFYRCETFLDYLRETDEFDALFLDIQLPGRSGVEAGRIIREDYRNEKLDIIYISSKESYALQLFKNRPLDFLIKPLTYEMVAGVLDVLVQRNGMRGSFFEYKANRINHRIPYYEIVYFRSEDKKIYIVLTNGEEKVFYGKLRDIAETLMKEMFLAIHQSYLVNIEYVQEFTFEWVKMENGDILNISKTYRKKVKEKLMQREL